jgi:hypothetical protein
VRHAHKAHSTTHNRFTITWRGRTIQLGIMKSSRSITMWSSRRVTAGIAANTSAAIISSVISNPPGSGALNRKRPSTSTTVSSIRMNRMIAER